MTYVQDVFNDIFMLVGMFDLLDGLVITTNLLLMIFSKISCVLSGMNHMLAQN